MPDALEVSLARVLRDAAEAAPEPAADAGVALLRARARRAGEPARHHGRLLAAAAAITVVILLVAAVTAVKLFRTRDVRPVSPPVRIAHTDYENGALVSDVWPSAVRTVPATIPVSGRPNGFNIERVLPDGQLLVKPVGDDAGISHLWALNPKTGKARPISPAGEQVVVVGQQVDAGATRWIVWIALPAGGVMGNTPAYLWYAPASGGKARKALTKPISTSAGTDGNALRVLISGDTVVISPALKPERGRAGPAIRTVRLGEDRVKTLKNSANMTVMQWPWLSDTRTTGNQVIRNAETGEKRGAVVASGWTDVNCSLSWCTGQVGKRLMVAHRDGSQARPLATGQADFGIVQDRFVVVAGQVVYDLQAAKALTLPRVVGEKSEIWHTLGFLGEGGGTPLFVWSKSGSDGQPESYLIVDIQDMV